MNRLHPIHRFHLITALGAALSVAFVTSALAHRQGESQSPIPPPAEKGVVVLFSGKREEVAANWLRRGTTEPAAWKLHDGAMVAGGGDIVSREKFNDYQLHVEFKVPYKPEAKGQARGNSGVYLYDAYEIQVLDSYGKADPGTGDCGALYNKSAPLINACRPPLQWQTYDIIFRAPRADSSGVVTERPRVTVIQNGIVVQNNVEISVGSTSKKGHETFGQPQPVRLQDHGNAVEFRNVWVLPLPEHGALHY